jgi:aryl-alcohol dehydrogenase-like predicted oxidoreductase
MSPSTLALSWCYHNPLVTSSIIGATTLEQLGEDLKAYDVRLGEATMKEIVSIYRKYTDPTKARTG